VNQTLKQFLVAGHRIDGDILPTPEDQKKRNNKIQKISLKLRSNDAKQSL
jgi:hypothetical protein